MPERITRPVGGQLGRHGRRQVAQHVGLDVGQDDIEGGFSLFQRAGHDGDALHVVALEVLLAALGGLGIVVDGQPGRLGPQALRRDGQDSRATPKVEKTGDAWRPFAHVLGQGNGQPGGRMGAGAEGPSGIEIDDELAGRGWSWIPAWPNREAAADARGAKELLPHVPPLALVGLALANSHGIDGQARLARGGQRLVGAGQHELAILGLAQRDHGGAAGRRGKQRSGVAQLDATYQGTDLGRQNVGGLGLCLKLDFEPDGQRITRLLASRRRRLRASRILRLRLTEGFSWYRRRLISCRMPSFDIFCFRIFIAFSMESRTSTSRGRPSNVSKQSSRWDRSNL
jgi:hypothetical protein